MNKKILLIILGLAVIGAVSLPFYVVRELNHSVSSNHRLTDFVVSDGETTSAIGSRLVEQKLINSKLSFLVYVYSRNKKIQSGNYELSADMSEKNLIDTISVGQTKTIRVTIPEGWRLEQIAARLEAKKVVKYDDFIQAAKGSEGYLFPDTYDFRTDLTAAAVARMMTANFDKRTIGSNLAKNDIILASIIEREAENDADRAGIAGVFANRLKINMKLQSDVTVIYQRDNNNYRTGDQSFQFWQKLASGDITRVTGSYSTYQNAGLPPGPICNPGLKSLEAAQNPAEHGYLYFLYGPKGDIHYASSQAQQDQNAQKYLGY